MSHIQNVKYYATSSGIVVGLWLVVALLISSITFIMALQEGLSLNAVEVITYEIFCISPWILSTPLIIGVTRKFRFETALLYKSLTVHFLTALLVFIFHSVVQSYEGSVYFDHAFEWAYIKRDFIRFLDLRLMLYVAVVLGIYAVKFQRKNRESRLKEPQLKAQLTKARYQTLLNQIHPVFLLNCLNSIREKIKSNPEGSEHLLIDFSDLLRIMLQNAYRESVTVQEDLESFYIYRKVLEKRLKTTIETKTTIQKDCYEVLVPSFLMLIPIFEEIISFDKKSLFKIKCINYNVKRKDDKVFLETVIKGMKEVSAGLSEYLQNGRFSDIRQRLCQTFDEPADLKINTFSNTIQINLIIPLRIQSHEDLMGIGYLSNQRAIYR